MRGESEKFSLAASDICFDSPNIGSRVALFFLDSLLNGLIEDFLTSTLSYFSEKDFAKKYALKTYKIKLEKASLNKQIKAFHKLLSLAASQIAQKFYTGLQAWQGYCIKRYASGAT